MKTTSPTPAGVDHSPRSFVYMVRCANGAFYTGWTVDVAARVAAHNAQCGSRYCARNAPVALCYVLECRTKIEALVLEWAIKKLSHASKAKLAQAYAATPRTCA